MLDCDFERIPGILHQANEIELLTDYHNYLVTSLDMDKINLEKYKDMVRMGKRILADNAEERGGRLSETYIYKQERRLSGSLSDIT